MTVHLHNASGYTHGCRCEVCTNEHTAMQRRRRAERKERAETDAPHGTVTGYQNWGCRCDDCKLAHSTRNDDK